MEEGLSRARADVTTCEQKLREKEDGVDRLHNENRDLTTQLAAQTQAKLNLSEKFDSVQSSLRTAETEVASYRLRIVDLEQRLSKDPRTLLSAENQYRDQLTERNALVLIIYQYMDKILGVDKTAVRVRRYISPCVVYSLLI